MSERTKFCSFASDPEKCHQFEKMMSNIGNKMNLPVQMLQSIGQSSFQKIENNKNITLSNYFTASPTKKSHIIQEILDILCGELKNTGHSRKMVNNFRDIAEIQLDIFFNEKKSLFS
ncbi:hypothetical protein NEF87_002974 [Candidatus Lokiarchaeum ossiferum]|uniref:Uncharacterized protein n=1 Tax=Candidatus Lokiarchaeum ossiferum TaxID=2951803 RepID=A0ABY6HT57_9ARCH|nr:hypothetical protein NEF87_002974 [Candidatus Lokiarchaeum sp. B-35]